MTQPTYWCRSGSAWGVTPPDSPRLIGMPAGAYGDSLGAMTIAGGIAGALFGRAQTGEPSVVDISLMSVGMWAVGLNMTNALLTGELQGPAPLDTPPYTPVNPLVGNYRTSDGRWINLNMLQPGRYFVDACNHFGLDHLVDDPRFATAEGIMEHAPEIGEHVAAAIAAKPYAYWIEHLKTAEGQWAPVQDLLEVASDPAAVANGYILDVIDADGNPRQLVANPVQFDETPPIGKRAPQFAEHTDEILRELGKTDDEILQLKIDGACT